MRRLFLRGDEMGEFGIQLHLVDFLAFLYLPLKVAEGVPPILSYPIPMLHTPILMHTQPNPTSTPA